MGNSFFIGVTAGTTGMAANPTITVPTIATGATPTGIAKSYVTATGLGINLIGDQTYGAGHQAPLRFSGLTPTASAGYAVYFSGT